MDDNQKMQAGPQFLCNATDKRLFAAATSINVRNLTALLWNIRKRRNALVFRLEEESCAFTLRRCSADLQLWRHRVQDRRAKLCLDAWSSFLCN